MNNKDYQEKAQRTAGTDTKEDKLLNAALGLTGEAGEFADHLKKHLMQGHDLDEGHLIKEVGDILWYCAEAAEGLGTTLDEIMGRNIAKLEERYPEGHFVAERSRNREEEKVVISSEALNHTECVKLIKESASRSWPDDKGRTWKAIEFKSWNEGIKAYTYENGNKLLGWISYNDVRLHNKNGSPVGASWIEEAPTPGPKHCGNCRLLEDRIDDDEIEDICDSCYNGDKWEAYDD